MAPGAAGEGPGTDECGDAVRARLADYAGLWAAAGTKLAGGRYGVTDLAEDWARWAGMAAQDATTAMSLLVRAMPDVRPGDAGPGDPAPGDPAGGPGGDAARDAPGPPPSGGG